MKVPNHHFSELQIYFTIKFFRNIYEHQYRWLPKSGSISVSWHSLFCYLGPCLFLLWGSYAISRLHGTWLWFLENAKSCYDRKRGPTPGSENTKSHPQRPAVRQLVRKSGGLLTFSWIVGCLEVNSETSMPFASSCQVINADMMHWKDTLIASEISFQECITPT